MQPTLSISLIVAACALALLAGVSGRAHAQAPRASEHFDPPTARLIEAAAAGDRDAARDAIAAGADLDARAQGEDGGGVRPLMWMIHTNDARGFRALLERGADPNAAHAAGNATVHLAAADPSPAYLDATLEHGGKANLLGADDKTPLIHAAASGAAASVERLLDAGSAIDAADVYGNTALHYAVARRHRPIVALLLDAGADPRRENDRGLTPAAVVRADPDHEAATLIAARLALPHVSEVFDDPAVQRLAAAAARNDVAAVQRLTAAGVNVDATGVRGMTPLIWAGLAEAGDGFTALLEAGADPNRRDDRGRFGVFVAAASSDPGMLRSAMRHEGNPSLPGPTGWTPLMAAVRGGLAENAVALVEAGAALNATDGLGRTALHHAVLRRRADLVKLLVDAGAATGVRADNGLTALELAATLGLPDAAAVLQ